MDRIMYNKQYSRDLREEGWFGSETWHRLQGFKRLHDKD
jgi:hypothetical protein